MDPTECLREIRRLTAKRNNDPSNFDSMDAATLCELVDGLDLWMTKGGFLPEQWSNTNVSRQEPSAYRPYTL